MTPHRGNTILFRSSQQLPDLRLGPSTASCVASGTTEMQGHRQVCCARRGGPRTLGWPNMHESKISLGTGDFPIVWTYLVREIHSKSKEVVF